MTHLAGLVLSVRRPKFESVYDNRVPQRQKQQEAMSLTTDFKALYDAVLESARKGCDIDELVKTASRYRRAADLQKECLDESIDFEDRCIARARLERLQTEMDGVDREEVAVIYENAGSTAKRLNYMDQNTSAYYAAFIVALKASDVLVTYEVDLVKKREYEQVIPVYESIREAYVGIERSMPYSADWHGFLAEQYGWKLVLANSTGNDADSALFTERRDSHERVSKLMRLDATLRKGSLAWLNNATELYRAVRVIDAYFGADDGADTISTCMVSK